MRITKEQLAAQTEEKRRRTEAIARAFAAGPVVPRAAPATSSYGPGPAATIRTVALGLGSLAAFAPAALLSDARPLGAGEALRNLTAVALLTLAPALSSSSAERAPEAEDLPRARLAQRFAPLVVGFALVAIGFFPWVGRWTVVQAALVLQAPLAFFLYVPRARACHAFVAGTGALATAVLDDRGFHGLAAFAGALLLGAALDRAVAVRRAANRPGPPGLGLPILGTLCVSGGGAALFALSLLVLPRWDRDLPAPRVVRATRSVQDGAPSTGELFVGLALIAFLLGVYQLVTERLQRKPAEAPPAPPPQGGKTGSAPLPDAPIDVAWPAGPRLAVVKRYLEHVAALAAKGIRRAPRDAPSEIAASASSKNAAVKTEADALARAFHEARYSPEPVSEETARRAAELARTIEETLS